MKNSEVLGVILFALAGPAVVGQQPVVPSKTAPHPVFSVDTAAERLENLDALKEKLKKYHNCAPNSGCYAHDLDVQADRAIDLLRKRVARRRPDEKLTLVLDIDETTLSNYPEMLAMDFGYTPSGFDAWAKTASASAIPGTLRLYKEARRLGVAVFFITGRPEPERAATERNLRAQGFDDWQELTLRPVEHGLQTTIEYKSAARARIVASGYTLALNVGDQWSDLKGAPQAEYNVKYPDPFYYIP